MPTLGQRLKEEREKKGLTIEELATRTRINPNYFFAIESDDTSSLPGGFFYRSFVRQYAQLLELPESAYAYELQQHMEADVHRAESTAIRLPERQFEVPPMPTGRKNTAEETRRWLLRLAILLLVIALSTGVYVFYQRWSADRAVPERQQPAPAQSQPPKPAESKPQEPVLVEQPAEGTALPAAGGAPADTLSVPTQTTPAQTTPAQTTPIQTPPAPAPIKGTPTPPVVTPPASTTAAAPATGAVRVVVQAKEPVWVDAWIGDKRVYSNLLPQGAVKDFGSDTGLRLRFGNAGGVEVEWNGKKTESAGPRGQIRVWEYRPDGYRMIPPAPKPVTEEAKPPAP